MVQIRMSALSRLWKGCSIEMLKTTEMHEKVLIFHQLAGFGRFLIEL
jgi:hypothetical protein